MTKPEMSLAAAILLITDLRDDLSSAPPVGFRLSQNDCWECAQAMRRILESHRLFTEEHIAWQEIREGMNR